MTSRVFGPQNKLGQSFLLLFHICEQCHWHVMGRVCAVRDLQQKLKAGQDPQVGHVFCAVWDAVQVLWTV